VAIELAKKTRLAKRPAGYEAFLLSHAKAPLREEKRDAVTVRYQHDDILELLDKSSFLKLT
jgi:hypothetical protein